MSRPIPRWLLPTLLVLNSLASIALASRAAELQREAQVWDLRAGVWLLGASSSQPARTSVEAEARRSGWIPTDGKRRKGGRRRATSTQEAP